MSLSPALERLERVALVTRDDLSRDPRSSEALSALISTLEARGVQVLGPHEGASLSDVTEEQTTHTQATHTQCIAREPEPDVVIALGGDGTVLKALVAYPTSPTLAVNFGSVGFLTQCDREGLAEATERLLRGEYWIEERLALEVSHKGRRARSINELVIKTIAHLCELSLWVDQHEVQRMRGDGLIIGTPTGSTAYLMSTGAPLVTPGVSCLIANPINEYSVSSRPIILPGDASVEVRVSACRDQDLVAVIDGGVRVPLSAGERLSLRRSPHPTRLITFERHAFFKNLHERLSWGAR